MYIYRERERHRERVCHCIHIFSNNIYIYQILFFLKTSPTLLKPDREPVLKVVEIEKTRRTWW